MNVSESIINYLDQDPQFNEHTAYQLSHRMNTTGPRYDVSSIRRALNKLHADGMVAKRRVGGTYFWRRAQPPLPTKEDLLYGDG